MEEARDAIAAFVSDNALYAPLAVAILAFIESLAIVSLFVPATMALLAIGALIAVSGVEFWAAWLAGAFGAFCGDMVSYLIGRHYQHAALRIWPLSRYPNLVARAQNGLRRHGAWWLFAGKFFGPTRTIGPLLAGISGMPITLFKSVVIASAMVWIFVLLAPGALVVRILLD